MSRQVRVVVVVDRVRGTVHGMTCDDAEAQQWCRELAERYSDNYDPARQYVGLVTPPEEEP